MSSISHISRHPIVSNLGLLKSHNIKHEAPKRLYRDPMSTCTLSTKISSRKMQNNVHSLDCRKTISHKGPLQDTGVKLYYFSQYGRSFNTRGCLPQHQCALTGEKATLLLLVSEYFQNLQCIHTRDKPYH